MLASDKNEPNCYIFVTGMSADIVKELAAIKLPINVVINVEVKMIEQKGKLSSFVSVAYKFGRGHPPCVYVKT